MVVLGISLVVYTTLIAFTGVQLRYLSFTDVYDVRYEFSDATVSLPFV